jgi:hypothetical protein
MYKLPGNSFTYVTAYIRYDISAFTEKETATKARKVPFNIICVKKILLIKNLYHNKAK